MVRDLTDAVMQQPDCCVETRNLTTLFVVVPRYIITAPLRCILSHGNIPSLTIISYRAADWESAYEELGFDRRIGGGVVPQSSR